MLGIMFMLCPFCRRKRSYEYYCLEGRILCIFSCNMEIDVRFSDVVYYVYFPLEKRLFKSEVVLKCVMQR